MSFDFVDHRHVTIGYDSYVAAGSPYRVIKNAGLNLPALHYLQNKHQLKPD